MKKAFNEDYPRENIREIEKWLLSKLTEGEEGALSDIGFRPTIIVEIIPNN